MNTLDISTINDLEKLKAMAYDAIGAKEAAQNNLNLLNQRIAELMEQNKPAKTQKS